jgi:hypothetical protein
MRAERHVDAPCLYGARIVKNRDQPVARLVESLLERGQAVVEPS